MKKYSYLLLTILLGFFSNPLFAQQKLDNILPVRGLSISAPGPASVDRFVKFINEELSALQVNTLILMINYNYQFTTYPELGTPSGLSRSDAKKLVDACKKNNIRIIPLINLLGHQGKLLTVYPQFEEPHADGIFKSYCPLHPDLHKIIFAVIDEITEVFETNAFHAGMDQVYYIGEDKCPRCTGRDKAALFANEVKKVNDHLKSKGKEMWMWGDRLLNAKAGNSSGLGYFRGSMDDLYKAVDLIPKNVVIADWQYSHARKTDIDFAMKGFRVVTCPWKDSEVAVAQLNDMIEAKGQIPGIKDRLMGMVQTVWGSVDTFLDGYYGKMGNPVAGELADYHSFKILFGRINKLGSNP